MIRPHRLITSLVSIMLSLLAVCPAQPTAPKGPANRKTNPKDGLNYVWIPPGRFLMGCSQGDPDCNNYEKPARWVTIAQGFWLGESEVTQTAYRKVTGQDPSEIKGPNRPVERVTWAQAVAYCRAIGGRLPSAAEWEYAARAGTVGIRYGELDRIAWYAGNSGESTHDVMQKEPNAWGLYDMLGNVGEFVVDTLEITLRQTRGGNYFNEPGYIRTSGVSAMEDGDYSSGLGIRCALK
jgi:formylglycine-generating enzyme required for sulfatase activity